MECSARNETSDSSLRQGLAVVSKASFASSTADLQFAKT